MKKTLLILLGAFMIGACKSGSNLPPYPDDVSSVDSQNKTATWAPLPEYKKPAEGQKCLINNHSCKDVIEILRQPAEKWDGLLKEWGLQITDIQGIRNGEETYTFSNGVTITTPSSVPQGSVYKVLLEDNTQFLFNEYEFTQLK